MLQRMLLFVISFMVFLKYTDSAANVVRVCPTSSFDSCDFNTLEDAVVYANANEGTTVEICGPMTYQGAITPVSARTHFRCGNCLRTNNNKKKKNMKKTKSTKSFWSGSSSQSKRTKSSSSTGSSSSSNDPNSSSTSAQSRRSFSTRPSLQTRPKPTARTNTAVRTCGSSSDVQIIPQENANPTFPFGFADDGAETGITAGHTFIGLSFVEGSSGSSVLNCNFMCDPTQDVGDDGADITVEIGVSIFAADQILVQNNQFSNCYYGVYVSQGSLNEVSWNLIDVLSYAFPKAAPELASSGIILIPAQQPVDPPTLPDFATQFNAIHDNCINVHGPTADECTTGITGGPINDDLFFCGTGGGIIILDEDVFADTEMGLKRMTSFNDLFQNQISRIGNPITTLWGILLFHRLNWASSKAFGCNFAINDNSVEQNFLDGLPILILGSDGNSILENDIVNIAANTGTVVGGTDGGWWTTERQAEADTRLGRAVPVSARAIMVAQGSANCIVSNEALDTVDEDFYIGTQDRQTCQPWDNSLIENVGWELRIDDTTNGGVIDLVNRNTVFVGNVFRSGRCNADNTVDGITTCARVFILPPPGFEMVCEVRQDSDNGATSITTSDLP